MNKISYLVPAAAAAAMLITACGGTPAPGPAATGGTTQQPAASAPSSPAAQPTVPANAVNIPVGNSQVTAWCTVYPNTDINGNPFNAWVITYDNHGPYSDAVYVVRLNFYDASGQLINTDDFSLTDGSADAMEVPAGVSTIGTNPASNLGDGYNEAPGNARACTIANHFGG